MTQLSLLQQRWAGGNIYSSIQIYSGMSFMASCISIISIICIHSWTRSWTKPPRSLLSQTQPWHMHVPEDSSATWTALESLLTDTCHSVTTHHPHSRCGHLAATVGSVREKVAQK